MDINSLHEHNREAYQKVMQHFNEGHQKACIEHPTASGKSYVITAVSDNFRRVLIVAPGTFVLEQVKSTIESESPEREIAPDYMTYAAIMKGKQVGTDYSNLYDLIVLDEYHHLGAEAWGAGIEYICGQNPNAKILGTTASPIRYSDKKRNMSDIFFKGNVLSRIDLGAAWARKILISPVYIMAIEDSDEFHNKFIRDIENSSLLEEKKQSFIQLVRAAKDKYEMNHTAPGIIEKHLLPDSRRVIVFSKDIKEAAENERKVRQWLLTADFTVAESYTLVSTDSDAVKKSKMADFQNDDFTGVKLMVAVDMLNEGVHVPRVDAVFFLRKTQSPSIHLQQMGRCMNRYKENARKPVIFDFRNNIINTMKCSVNDMFAKEMKSYDKELCKKKGKKVKSDTVDTEPKSVMDAEEFENLPTGINYCMDTSLLYERFKQDVKWQGKWSLLEEYVGVAEIYYKQHNKRIPVTGGYVNVCCSLNKFLRDEKRQAERPELVERLRNCGFEKDKLIMKYALIAEDYYIKHGKKIPTIGECGKVYTTLMNFWKDGKKRDNNPDVVEILQRSGFVDKIKEDKLMKYALFAEEFYKQHGKKIPGDREYKNIYSRLMYFWRDKKRRAERPDVVGILQRSGFDKDLLLEYTFVAGEYYKQHGKKIPKKGKYYNVCQVLNNFLRDEKRQAERPELVERLRNCGFEKDKLIMKYALIAEDYYIKHGKKIPTTDEYENVCGSLNRFWRNKERRAENPDVVEILQRSGFVDKVRDLLIKYALVAEEYYKRYGKKIPGDREYKNIYSRLMYFWRDKKRRAERPNIVEILSRSGFKDK